MNALFTKAVRLIEPAWVADTQRHIHTAGHWPKSFPYPHLALDGCALIAINLEAESKEMKC